MGHYKTGATRAEATDPAWLPVGRQIGSLANQWAERHDIVAYVGPGAGGPAPACFIPASAEIEVNVDVAFGFGVKPNEIDLMTRGGRYEFPVATGAVFHEACHARFSMWDVEQAGKDLQRDEYDALMLLEEGRIEARGILHLPRMRTFLRSCAMELIVADSTEQFRTMGSVQAAANLTAMVWSRVDGGILPLRDVAELTDMIDDCLGLDVSVRLREIATKARDNRNDHDGTVMYPLAIEWAQIVRDLAAERGESIVNQPMPGAPGGGEDSSEGEGEPSAEVQAMLDAMMDAADAVAISTFAALDESEQGEKDEETVKERQERGKEVKKARDTAIKVFGRGTGPGAGTGTASTLRNTRPPSADERRAAHVVASRLEKAKYRDRDATEIRSTVPPGRLRSRAIVQGAALRERGVMQQPEAWRRTVRKHTDEPTLTVGVLVDISGSMGSAMEPMATTAYVLSEATARVQGRAAMVYFGNSVFATLRPGERMSEVKVYSAPDGTEEFDEAFRALDGSLNLLSGNGARLLVVVSDGVYTSPQTVETRRWMRRCAQEGVAVVWLPFDDGHMAKHFAKAAGGVVLPGMLTPTDAAQEIGAACERAISETTTRKAS